MRVYFQIIIGTLHVTSRGVFIERVHVDRKTSGQKCRWIQLDAVWPRRDKEGA